MCQLNVYCLSEKISKEKIRKIFNRSFGANPETVCVDDKFNMKENSTRFCYYVNGWCNCDSVISCCQEYDGKLSFDEYYTQLCKKEVKRLSEIQHFMKREEYSKEKTVFDEKIQRLQAELDKEFKTYLEKIGTHWQSELENENEENFAYKQALRKYQEFIEENRFMWESYGFYIKRKKFETDVSDINIAKKKARIGRKKELKKEFYKIKRVLGNILKLSERIGIFSYWKSEEQAVELQCGREIKYNDFKIEDIAFLKNRQVLWIVK